MRYVKVQVMENIIIINIGSNKKSKYINENKPTNDFMIKSG